MYCEPGRYIKESVSVNFTTRQRIILAMRFLMH